MRLKIIFIVVLLLSMAALPIVVSGTITAKKPQKASALKSEQTKISKTEQNSELKTKDSEDSFSKEKLCGLTAALYQENYNIETIKSIALILNTNFKAQPERYDFDDKDICIYEDEAENSLRENYSLIKSAVDEVYEKTLCQNDKAFYIPYSDFSNGTTKTNSDYPYLQNIASPWDCYCDKYDEDAECVGVSLYGLNYLCNQGYDYESALKWYLPDFEIK